MWFDRLRAISLLLAYGTAVIPFVTYITDESRDLLWPLIGANIFAYIMVALTTIRITLDVTGREKAKTFVPARYADNPVWSKWYSAVRLSWKWHVLAAVARMGLVLGIVEWLRISCDAVFANNSIFQATLYFVGCNPAHIFPQAETAFAGILLLILFSVAESGLLTSLSLLTTGLRPKYRGKNAWNYGLRLSIALAAGGILVISLDTYHQLQTTRFRYYTSNIYVVPTPDEKTQIAIAIPTLRAVEGLQLAIFSFTDNGIMAVANIMRPVDTVLVQRGRVTYCWDNRPFVARNIVAGLLGLLLYAGLTRFFLGLASRRFKGEFANV